MGPCVLLRGESVTPLVDAFGRRHTYVRVSVTDRCNLRCRYCMPAEGMAHSPREAVLDFDEILRLVRLLARMGVSKVRITGGEPLVRRGIRSLVAAMTGVAGITTVGMTSNGVLLAAHARALREAGLTHLNVSLDTLRPERFARIALRDRHQAVRDGIGAAVEAGFVPLKINVVVMGGINDDELLDFVELAREAPFAVRFIEFMPFTTSTGWTEAGFVSYETMRRRIEARHALFPVEPTGGSRPVAREFRIEGFTGTVGFITPMSDHFCGSCNRLRLMANGSVKSCLFSPPVVDLLGPLRAGAPDEDLAALLREAVSAKLREHPPVEALKICEYRSMVEIGG